MSQSRSLYEGVVRIVEDYFGPTTRRILSRLIVNHLNKEPEELAPRDMKILIQWLSLAVNTITEDTETSEELIERLQALQPKPKSGQSGKRQLAAH